MDNKMNKVESGHEGEIIVASSDGGAKVSGVKIGSESIATNPNQYTVATEKAVVDYVSNNTIPKDRISRSDQLPNSIDDASDEKLISEKSLLTILQTHCNDLIDASNEVTGLKDTTMTEVVNTLIAGYNPVLQELNVIENGEYIPETGVNGFSKVIANIKPSYERTAWYRPPDWPDITSLPLDSTYIESWYVIDKYITETFKYTCNGYDSYIEIGDIIDGEFNPSIKYDNSDTGAFSVIYNINLSNISTRFQILHYKSDAMVATDVGNQYATAGTTQDAPIIEVYTNYLHGASIGSASHGHIYAITIGQTTHNGGLSGLSTRPFSKAAVRIDLSGLAGIICISKALYSIFSNSYSLKEVIFPKLEKNSILLDVNSQSNWPSCAFQNCYSLINLDLSIFDTSECTDITSIFDGCNSLRTLDISGWNLSALEKCGNAFKSCASLVNLITDGCIMPSISFDLKTCISLSVDSLVGVIAALPTLAEGTTATLTLGAINIAKLTEEQLAVATEKGWTIA